jgi:hypothetical protein
MHKKLKDTYYFTHDSNARNDEKILEMRAIYGYEGYGLYWAIIEMLRDASDNKLSIKSIIALSIALNYDSKMLKKFIEDCINIFGLFILDGDEKTGKYYSNRLLRNVKKYKQISSKRSAIAKQMHSNKTKLNKTKLNKSIDNADSDFIKFWDIYNKKVDRDKAFKKWQKLSKADIQKIFETVSDYVESTPDIQFRKNPATYLNNKSWENEITSEIKSTYGRQQAPPNPFGEPVKL